MVFRRIRAERSDGNPPGVRCTSRQSRGAVIPARRQCVAPLKLRLKNSRNSLVAEDGSRFLFQTRPMFMLGMLAATGRNSMRWPSAKAVQAAGSTDTAAVTAQLEKMKDEPTLFGPRTFTSEIHHQNRGRYLIVDTEAGKPDVVDEWTISNAIPVADLLK